MDDSEIADPEKQKILEKLLSEFSNLDDLDPEYSIIINESFWELLYT
jgi:hypothetical protein